jgi:putative NADPH-quinone reductase
MKSILILNGHPDKESFCAQLAEAYEKGVLQSGTPVKLVHLSDLDFNPVLEHGYHKRTELEPKLIEIQKDIKKATHLVFVFPIWWGNMPALLKGFIDRVFLPGYAFQYREKSVFWDKMLNGKSARIIATMDSPVWYYKWIYHSPGTNALKKAVLNFCGIKPVRVTHLGPVKSSDENKRTKWLQEIEQLGIKGE